MRAIEIRPMQAEEAEAVAALARVVWQDTYRGIISQAQIDTMLAQRYSAEEMRTELASGEVWWDVLEAEGEIVAFACYFLACQSGEMKLDKLYVHPAHQRHGYGARLLARVEAAARDEGCRTLMLAVNKKNTKAIAAYRKYAFAVREAVVQDIGGGFVMDDYIMEKSLAKERPMTFENPGSNDLRTLLKKVKTIAVVGLSPKPDRPSYGVAKALQRFGYRIIPVRPAVDEVLGEKAYPSLKDVPEKIDLVDVFRAAEHVDGVVDECLALNLSAIWLQEGIINEAAAERAKAAGMTVVMDRCIYKDYMALLS